MTARVDAKSITDLQIWAMRGFALEIGDVALSRQTDRDKLATGFNILVDCYPKFAAVWTRSEP